jgi:hypothetical protein
MKTALVLLLALHGLIHLMGPAKAFGWAELPGLRQPISRGAAVAWGLTAVLLLAAAAMALLGPRFPDQEWWWVPALAGIALSQVLILGAWRDAKLGTIANLLLIVPVVVSAASSRPADSGTSSASKLTHIGRACPPGPPMRSPQRTWPRCRRRSGATWSSPASSAVRASVPSTFVSRA